LAATRNRKKRREVASLPEESSPSFNPSSIPLAFPPSRAADSKTTRSRESGPRTLLEIAAERQAELGRFAKHGFVNEDDARTILNSNPSSSPKTEFLQISRSGEVSSFDPDKLNNNGKGEIQNGRKDTVTAGNRDSDLVDRREENESIPPVFDTLLLSLPLACLHCTLAFLAAHQYSQDIYFKELLWDSVVVAFPILSFCIHLAHGHLVRLPSITALGRQPPGGSPSSAGSTDTLSVDGSITAVLKLVFPPRTVVFLPLAFYFGAAVVHMTNESPFYAIIKQTPALGTLWVWCILEMSPAGALLGVLGPLGWGTLWKGYSII